MMIDDAFEIHAPITRVWPVLTDIPRVATCMPGTVITDVIDPKTYRAKVQVKVGPVSVSYSATIGIASVDEITHTATLNVQGDEIKGRGGVRATMTSQVEEHSGNTLVKVHTDAQISGIIATVGGRLIESVAKKMTSQFAHNLEALV